MAIRTVDDLPDNLWRKQRVRRPFVRELRGWSNSTLDRKIARGEHPAPLPKTGPGPDEWPLSAVLDNADQTSGETAEQFSLIRKLRARTRDSYGRLMGNAPKTEGA